jgi:hypothetical protein
MIKNSVPFSAIVDLSPEEKQNHTIGLLTSIDQTLKKLLIWTEPSSHGNMIQNQYEMSFGAEVDFDFDLKDLSESKAVISAAEVVETAEKIAAAKPRATRKAAAPVAAAIEQTSAPEETTLAIAPVTSAAPVAAVTSEVTIDEVRNAAQKFIIDLTGKGQNGKEVFSGLLKDQGCQILTALDKSKYSVLLAEMAKTVPAVAAQVFDPLA